jgi:hypothetical protein
VFISSFFSLIYTEAAFSFVPILTLNSLLQYSPKKLSCRCEANFAEAIQFWSKDETASQKPLLRNFREGVCEPFFGKAVSSLTW